ncbi:MAG: ABC transporter ATP-binding protein [Syntrophomonadaceae bacterium]|nr:ABC transporter ATP-binding protein [Syntrophomonadaceae bacterium]MDD3890006.1 ABC transporter ATP-binding protein [Syntrophomonadaceae bacterium]MDD4550082.1 ABC transporter ATP-binding protein [Syntrophomonadaceae bacterium]
MIKIRDLSVKYHGKNNETLALDKLSVDIGAGDIYTFIGPSGCGKSTLLYVLSGILNDYTGNVSIDGRNIDPKTKRIGLILQHYGLLPWKNVYQNVLLGVKIKKDKQGLDEYSHYILKKLEIDTLLDRYPKELSGGQQQRVAIARAFILKPDLLLMDEPFSALDAITREKMQELFLEIWQQNRVTTVFITHSVDEALYLGSKIVVLSPAPGKVKKILENRCFQLDNLRTRDEYYAMSMQLREIVSSKG